MRRIASKGARLRTQQMHDKKDQFMEADHQETHYFKVFRLKEDVCAKCGKPRAAHPKQEKKK